MEYTRLFAMEFENKTCGDKETSGKLGENFQTTSTFHKSQTTTYFTKTAALRKTRNRFSRHPEHLSIAPFFKRTWSANENNSLDAVSQTEIFFLAPVCAHYSSAAFWMANKCPPKDMWECLWLYTYILKNTVSNPAASLPFNSMVTHCVFGASRVPNMTSIFESSHHTTQTSILR